MLSFDSEYSFSSSIILICIGTKISDSVLLSVLIKSVSVASLSCAISGYWFLLSGKEKLSSFKAVSPLLSDDVLLNLLVYLVSSA